MKSSLFWVIVLSACVGANLFRIIMGDSIAVIPLVMCIVPLSYWISNLKK